MNSENIDLILEVTSTYVNEIYLQKTKFDVLNLVNIALIRNVKILDIS